MKERLERCLLNLKVFEVGLFKLLLIYFGILTIITIGLVYVK